MVGILLNKRPVVCTTGLLFILFLNFACVSTQHRDSESKPVSSLSQLLKDIKESRSPINHLSDYAKEQFIASTRWSERGLGGFSVRYLVRELTTDELKQILDYLGAQQYYDMIAQEIGEGSALRFGPPSEDLRPIVQDYLQALERALHKKYDDDHLGVTHINTELAQIFQRDMAKFYADDYLKLAALQDLLPLLDAAIDSTSISFNELFINGAMSVADELHRRQIDTRRDIDGSIYAMLTTARKFDRATRYLAEHPIRHVKSMPITINALGQMSHRLTAYEYSPETNTLTRKTLSLADTQLIVFVGEGCHFSAQALKNLINDKALLAKAKALNIALMTLPSSGLELEFVAKWNKAHPELKLGIPYDSTEWSALDRSAVPSFVMLKKGKVVESLEGWPEKDGRQRLIQFLNKYKK